MRIVLLASLLLIRLPTLFNKTEDPMMWSLALAPFWAVILHTLLIRPLRAKHPTRLAFTLREGIPALAFVGLTLASFPRAAGNGAIRQLEALGHLLLWSTVALFAVAAFLIRPARAESPNGKLREIVVHALGTYVVANVVLHFAGLESQTQIYIEDIYRSATLLGAAGIQIERVLFPTAGGIGSFGTVAGASLVGAILAFSWPASLRNRAWLILTAAASAYAVLASDSRSALLYTILSVGAVSVFPRLLTSFARALPLLAGLFPMALVGISPWLSRLEHVELISRSGADVATLNSRTYVWDAGLAGLRELDASALLGHGYEGHYTSRVSEMYRAHFQSFERADRTGLHNALLQYTYDVGVVGAALFLFCFARLMTALANEQKSVPGTRAVFGMAIYIMLAGATDSIPTPYSQELFLVFILLLVSVGSASQPSLPSGPEFTSRETDSDGGQEGAWASPPR